MDDAQRQSDPDRLSEADDGLSERQQVRLEQRAIRQRWPIGDFLKERIVKKAGRICMRPGVDDKTALLAARTVMLADRLNLDQERLDLDSRQQASGTVRDLATEFAAAAERYESTYPGGIQQVQEGSKPV